MFKITIKKKVLSYEEQRKILAVEVLASLKEGLKDNPDLIRFIDEELVMQIVDNKLKMK